MTISGRPRRWTRFSPPSPITVPVLLVGSLWDAEDIYGYMAVWKALKPKDTNNMVRLSIGPWYHGQGIDEGSSLGAIKFGQDTSFWWRHHVLAPTLAHYLKDEAPPLDVAPVTVFETGTNEWRSFQSWPAGGGKSDADLSEAEWRFGLRTRGGPGCQPSIMSPTP